MASEKPPPAAAPAPRRAKLPPAQREYAALRLFLTQEAGFRLGLATFDRPATREGLVARLTEDLAREQVLLSTLDLLTGEGSLLDRLEQHLAEVPTPPAWCRAVSVINLETRLDPGKLPIRYGPEADRDLSFFEEGNLHRDAFPSVFSGPLLFWLTRLAESDFAKSAPDLWHWRSARFDFQSEGTWLNDFRNEPAARAAWYEQIAAASHRLGDKAGEVGDRIALGNAKKQLGDPAGAALEYEAALKLARGLGDRRLEGRALGSLGRVHLMIGDSRKALELDEQALMIFREVVDRHGEAVALGNLGVAYGELGDYRKAIEFHTQALAIDREIGSKREEAINLWNLAISYARLGDLPQAITHAEQALDIPGVLIATEVESFRAAVEAWRSRVAAQQQE